MAADRIKHPFGELDLDPEQAAVISELALDCRCIDKTEIIDLFLVAGPDVGLDPRPSEAVIDKITMSAFEGNPLDIVLRDCGVHAYLIAGVALEVGIEPTVRHSADLGYIPVVVRDACGAGDAAAGERALAAIAFAGDAFVADTDEVCSILAADGVGGM